MPDLLSSLKILDFSTLVPGPFASLLLADWGADVIRVEAPDRLDMMRLQPPFDGEHAAWHAVINRNKRSLSLNLKHPAAPDVVKQLVQEYDIVLEQFRPGVMDRLGVGYDALRAANPRLIYCAISGFGQDGPDRDRAAHDINLVARSGIAGHSGYAASGPPPLGIQIADMGSSFIALTGLLAAVIYREQTGIGQMIDVSMLDAAMTWNTLAATEYLVGGVDPTREGSVLTGGGYYGYYRTRDDRYLAVGSLEPKFWQGFCQAIDRPDLVELGLTAGLRDQQRARAGIAETIAQRTLAEWEAVFAPLDLCVEPVLTMREACEQPQAQARGRVVHVPRPDGGAQPQLASPLRFSACEPTYRHIGATLGEHTAEIMTGLGYRAEQIEAWQAEGMFGQANEE
ncbi:MAG: CoA transferase [Caldilineaceae bacterium]|nr:CoA transferase [Caldilineaceae bacterium]